MKSTVPYEIHGLALTWQLRVPDEVHVGRGGLALLRRRHQVIVFVQRQLQLKGPYLSTSLTRTITAVVRNICTGKHHVKLRRILHHHLIIQLLDPCLENDHKFTEIASGFMS